MGIIKNIRDYITPQKETIIRTKYGNYNLAKDSDVAEMRKQIIKIQQTTDALIRRDIKAWRTAWQLAINVDYPDRNRLYDIYTDVDVDLHLTGCLTQRSGFVESREFKFIDKNGKEDEKALNYFETEWFEDLIGLILESNYWGHSLIELGDVIVNSEGLLTYDGVELINRKHVVPEYHRVVETVYEDWRSGVDYHEKPFSPWLIEVGKPKNLGLFLKAATQTIPKKNVMAYWDTFSEIFGMPLRIAKTATRDEKELAKIDKMLATMGTEAYGVFQEGTELEMVETGKTDSYNVYDKRIDRANKELSKLILASTMTIEDGSSLSQSSTHLDVLKHLVNKDRKLICNTVNNKLIPRMVAHGFPVDGLRMVYDDSTEYTPSEKLDYEKAITDIYDVDQKYFENEYNMPIIGKKQSVTPTADGDATMSARQPFFG